MKKFVVAFLLGILVALSSKSQLLTAQDSLMINIPLQHTYTSKDISDYAKANFLSDSARMRALFVWVANNISYDIERLLSGKPQLEKPKIEDVLKIRKAVCEGYAQLLVELYSQCNIQSIVIPGYTRHQDGSISILSHAWVAAMLNGKWWLFDPTFSAGTVNNNRFTRRFTNRFYKLAGEEMIKDHMPFDPMHQFVFYPVTTNEFYEGKTAINTAKPYFNFADTLKIHNSLQRIDQAKNTVRRIQSNGVRNDNTRKMLEVLTKNTQSHESKTVFDEASGRFQLAITLFNRYIDHKNKRFSSLKENREIEQMLDSIKQYAKEASAIISPIITQNVEQVRLRDNFYNAIQKLSQRVDDEKAYVKKYFMTVGSSR